MKELKRNKLSGTVNEETGKTIHTKEQKKQYVLRTVPPKTAQRADGDECGPQRQ